MWLPSNPHLCTATESPGENSYVVEISKERSYNYIVKQLEQVPIIEEIKISKCTQTLKRLQDNAPDYITD